MSRELQVKLKTLRLQSAKELKLRKLHDQGQGSVNNSNHTTLPATTNHEVITTGDQRLQRYLLDGFNIQLGNIQNKT